MLAHPGYTATTLQTSAPTGMVKMLFGRVLIPLARSPDRGALPRLYAATDPSARGGEFIGPDGPARVALSPAAADVETGRRLRELSERLTDVRFPLRPVSD